MGRSTAFSLAQITICTERASSYKSSFWPAQRLRPSPLFRQSPRLKPRCAARSGAAAIHTPSPASRASASRAGLVWRTVDATSVLGTVGAGDMTLPRAPSAVLERWRQFSGTMGGTMESTAQGAGTDSACTAHRHGKLSVWSPRRSCSPFVSRCHLRSWLRRNATATGGRSTCARRESTFILTHAICAPGIAPLGTNLDHCVANRRRTDGPLNTQHSDHDGACVCITLHSEI